MLIMVVIISLGLGVNWYGGSALATQPVAQATPTPVAQANRITSQNDARPPVLEANTATPVPAESGAVTPTVDDSSLPAMTGTLGPLPTSAVIGADYKIEPGDAPLLVQAPGTMNILLLGSDAAANKNYARTDTILIASVNPEMPSVSLLSLPRDLQVRIPGHADDRINTAFELGYINDYPGGGPAFLALVLRKNFGVKIDHYIRIDFTGFIKAVNTLGGVEVLVECELHDTFPDSTVSGGRVDLDVYPGKAELTGKQALMYARSRWSTTDFDRARRQQKVLRSLLSKVKKSNLLQNALGLYQDFQENVDTDLGLAAIPTLVDIITRLENLAIKNRVVTYPVIKAYTRKDGAMVLLPITETNAYVADALSPPAGNRAQTRPRVEVVNATGKPDLELVAAERLGWEGFNVVSAVVTDTVQDKTEIINYSVTPKGSPISRLAGIFGVRNANITADPDPSGDSVALIVLGADYNSCPRTSVIAGDVVLAPTQEVAPTATPVPQTQ
jgi:LCP family protein required for cell wall assembly